MARRPKVVKPANPVDPRNADERVVDQAFEVQIRELIKERRWSELEAACMLHGSTLSRREED